jgi:hypothetical protein
VWILLAVGVVAAVGVGVRRWLFRPAPGIDVGAVSERWMADNRAGRNDRFL